MSEITTVGLDLAKNVFQVHAVNEAGTVVLRKRLSRSQMPRFFAKLSPCLIGMEACATSHYWAREMTALGHEVRLIPPAPIKPTFVFFVFATEHSFQENYNRLNV
mgnify:CR=1 FL=1